MLSDLWIRLRALLRRSTVEAELDEELRFHLTREADKLAASGLSREDAWRRARIDFGGVEQIKEDCRDARGIRFLDELGQDLRHAIRLFGRTPAFAAAIVLTLAIGIGVYSVMANAVAERTHELGVRMALGADRPAVLRLVLWQSARITFAGLGLGLAGALILTRSIQSLLFEVAPSDPAPLGAATAVLAAVALLACMIPAHRAATVDPAIALRGE